MGYYSSTLQKGSQGDEVKQWQQFLNSQGYSLTVDGDFGDKTYAATTEWQSKNGLGADGIVGKNTWGKAGFTPYSTASTPTAAPTANPLPTNPTYETTSWDDTQKGKDALGSYNTAKDQVNNYGNFTYEDYQESEAVKGAGDALNAHNATKPGEYQSQWQSQLDSLMNSIMNREKFSYDFNGDALYQQYKDKYIQQGKLAMQDTMGQAAAMTGGYGNSYAASVGNQAYQAQLDNLNDIVPELYAMALDKYNREGQELYNQYGMVADRENLDYGRYRDTMADFLTERDYLQGRYDTERGFDYGKYVDDRNLEYTLHQDGYNRLMDSLGIAQGDYYSGADMFNTEQANRNNVAGQQFDDAMSIWGAEKDQAWKQAEWDEAARLYANDEAWRQKEWAENQRRYEESKVSTIGESGGGGNNSGGSNYNNGGYDDATVKAAQEFVGASADGQWGPKSAAAAKEAGYNSIAEVVAAMGKKDQTGFTGSSYNDAYDYAVQNGVPAAHAAGIMTQTEWVRRKASYKRYGTGDAEVKNYNSYKEYLAAITEYLVEQYN
jgi:peptidoglycan hydrolase-like protein with peptidoglycan-binding domain